ncbi:metallophosphoesterase family protein [Haladaptatus caseinilyticus]|uniref:metallophosphoesterase family protein n=1 Tax=Haladaptatus caseinilyticus TaxID=2993314 RepID=UPI00224AA39E|nr:metallophosphoesterase [Haladaptatus caseinilyticus]
MSEHEMGTERTSIVNRQTDLVVESPDNHTDSGPVFARFSRPRSDVPTTIALVSDTHVSAEKRGTWKVFHRTQSRLRTVLADANARDVDAVVFAGDLTEDGAVEDFETFDSILSTLEIPFVAVPGNHDVPKSFDTHQTPALSSFESEYTPGELPFLERVGGVDIIGLNSAETPSGSLADCHDGAVSDSQLAWLDETLPRTEEPIVVMHHNLPGLSGEDGVHSWRRSFPTRNADELVATLARHDVPLHVSGHLHVPSVTKTSGVREVIAPSLCSFPQAYLQFEIGPAGTTVRLVPTADSEGTKEAYIHATQDTARSDAVAEMTLDRLSTLPLSDEWPSTRD